MNDITILAWPAMRYALGRKTYVTNDVSSVLVRRAFEIPKHVREKMALEIEKAIKSGNAGMDMDVEDWQRVLDAFKELDNG